MVIKNKTYLTECLFVGGPQDGYRIAAYPDIVPPKNIHSSTTIYTRDQAVTTGEKRMWVYVPENTNQNLLTTLVEGYRLLDIAEYDGWLMEVEIIVALVLSDPTSNPPETGKIGIVETKDLYLAYNTSELFSEFSKGRTPATAVRNIGLHTKAL